MKKTKTVKAWVVMCEGGIVGSEPYENKRHYFISWVKYEAENMKKCTGCKVIPCTITYQIGENKKK